MNNNSKFSEFTTQVEEKEQFVNNLQILEKKLHFWVCTFGAYDEDDRGTLNIGKGVKTMSIEKDYSWSTIPVEWNPMAFAQQRCHVLIQTCDHPGGHTAQTCIFCKH